MAARPNTPSPSDSGNLPLGSIGHGPFNGNGHTQDQRHPLPADGLLDASAVPTADDAPLPEFGRENGDGTDGGGLPPAEAAPHTPPPDDPPFRALMDRNFLSYASYVIRDRAIPALEDGLKPVQRRILHSLHRNDDGKFIKVANIVGYSMQFHPHGDASIADALVVLQQKRYLIEGQGNFGNIYTGDPAAASRYIECRLTDLARNEIFNDKITQTIPSYDGRNQEPVTLPAKLPLLLMLGAEGIAVGLSTRVLPHNFCELIDAQIAILQGKPFDASARFPAGRHHGCQRLRQGRGQDQGARRHRAEAARPRHARHPRTPGGHDDGFAHRFHRGRRAQEENPHQVHRRFHG